MRDEKDKIIADAIEALRNNAEGLRTQGFVPWAETTKKIADHLERKHAGLPKGEWATLLSMPGLVIRIAWALISWPVLLLLGLRKPDTYDAR